MDPGLLAYLDDPDKARIFIPAEDQDRWDDENDHGDPVIERWARGLGAWGPAICARATLACAQFLEKAWVAELPGDTVVPEALRAATSPSATARQQALAALEARERTVGWAHLHDTLRAARSAILAGEPGQALYQVELAALFAFRVVSWSSYPLSRAHAPGEAALWAAIEANASFASALALPDNPDRCRQITRIAVRDALAGKPAAGRPAHGV
ncbi:MAG: hypothetical protein U0359_19235 [Byssovorax sp.]